MDDGERPNWSTEYWLGRWRDGDRDAGGRLYEHFLLLLRLAVRNGPSWSQLRREYDVDDVVNGLWSILFSNNAKSFTYRGPNTFAAWLQTALSGYEVDLLRKSSRQKRGSGRVQQAGDDDQDAGRAVPLAAPTIDPTPTSTARARELIDRAKRTLNDDEHRAFVLMKLEGYTSDEVGLALRRSGAAIRSLVDRAQRKLIDDLGEVASP